MAIIVEDGTGTNPDANSYNTLQEFKDYFATIGVDISNLTDPQIEAGLIDAATNYLEYCYVYKGVISHPDIPQPLLWPRAGLCDRRKLEIPDTTIPTEVKKAQLELARSAALSLAEQERFAFSDEPEATGAVKSSKLDVLSESYYGPGSEIQTTISASVQSYVAKLLQPYLGRGASPFQINNFAVV